MLILCFYLAVNMHHKNRICRTVLYSFHLEKSRTIFTLVTKRSFLSPEVQKCSYSLLDFVMYLNSFIFVYFLNFFLALQDRVSQ